MNRTTGVVIRSPSINESSFPTTEATAAVTTMPSADIEFAIPNRLGDTATHLEGVYRSGKVLYSKGAEYGPA